MRIIPRHLLRALWRAGLYYLIETWWVPTTLYIKLEKMEFVVCDPGSLAVFGPRRAGGYQSKGRSKENRCGMHGAEVCGGPVGDVPV